MHSLFDCGLRHTLDGDTTVDELLRVTDVPKQDPGGPTAVRGARAKARPGGTAPIPADDSDDLLGDAFATDEVLAGLELLDDPGAVDRHGALANKATILLVEDEDSLRKVLKDLLERDGYTICEARDGAEAMEQVDRHNPDLVLLDLNLPNIDGFTVLEKLRAHPRTADLPVMVLSARSDEENEVRVLQLGATDFLAKPFRPKALSARLERTLAKIRNK
jgi:CheY-like chemotaxis protein